jgi:hypothetical protein
VFAGFPLNVCSRSLPLESAGDPGSVTPSETNCCRLIGCACYEVNYIGPPDPEFPTIGVTYFSYTNCSNVLVNTAVGNDLGFPLFQKICAQEGSITITGGDEGCGGSGLPCAVWDVTTGVDCCLSFFPAFISETPEPINGCAATLDTPCYVSNINTTTPGQEIISGGSTVYLDAAGTIPFIGAGVDNFYKITITGSAKCTSSEVAPDGDVGGFIGICSTCP